MEKESNIKEISDLIIKMIKQEITEEEKRFLTRWLDESEDHQQLYNRLVNERYILEQYRLKENINIHKAWQKVSGSSKKGKIHYIGYAAAAIILFVGITSIYLQTQQPKKDTQQTTTVASAPIAPGSGKAILIISDQQEIQLGKNRQINMTDSTGVKYQNDSSTLYYQAEKDINTNLHPEATHTLVVGRGGEYCVKLSDGTKVYLNSDSKLKYPVVFTREERKVQLEGEAYFEVSPDENHPFIVEGKDFNIRVLGTSFNVSNYKEDDVARVVLLEGLVQVNKMDKKYKLIPNEALEMNGNQVSISKINAANAISWKNDKFYFSNERLEVVMTKLARWYDVSLSYTNQTIKDYHFTGFIPKYTDISKAFTILELTTDVKFEVKDRNVTIMRKE